MFGTRSWFAGFFFRTSNKPRTPDYLLTPLEKDSKSLKNEYKFRLTRLDLIKYIVSSLLQEDLRSLWNTSFPDIELEGLVSNQWKDMGWQGNNPSTDFRGCGYVSLENLLFYARTSPRLLLKLEGARASWEYLFAVAGIHVSFMLIQMLDLYSERHKTIPAINFLKILGEDQEAFDVLYCIAFQMVDAQWLAMRASYMQFNEFLQVTRIQLERELALEDLHRIQDMPAYYLLYK